MDKLRLQNILLFSIWKVNGPHANYTLTDEGLYQICSANYIIFLSYIFNMYNFTCSVYVKKTEHVKHQLKLS